VFIEGDQIQLLTDMGFTKTQAKIYLALLKLEEADGRTLSNKTNVARPEVYRTLNELQRKGLVEKEITTPYKFKTAPAELGLQILIDQKIQQCKEIQLNAKNFIQKLKTDDKKQSLKPKHRLIMVEGRQRLMQIIKKQHSSARRNVNILTTLPRWLQILHFCFENYEKGLDRGVRYQVILEAQEDEIASHENVQALLRRQNFELRLAGSPLQTNAAIFDDNEVTVNFFPSQSLAESPLIWTNHPSFISMCQDHFEKIWKTAS
jgi:sugar-specific transcriptional regulator TrmB